MSEVLLKEISRENWEEALHLSVRPDQQRFTPTVAVSLAKAYIRPEGPPNTPYAVYADGQMVGFLNTVCDPRTTDTYWINGVLIDHACQGRGYGRAAMEQVIALLVEKYPRCAQISLTVHPENTVAQRLYRSLGFIDGGEMLGEEMIWRLPVRRERPQEPYVITLEPDADPSDRGFVEQGLSAYNRQFTEDDSYTRLHVFLRDRDGQIVGGLLGGTYWGWLYVAILWLDESVRRGGWGTRLMAAAEAEALRRGCHHVHLDTMDFQALPFYRKLGFTLFGALKDMPLGHERYFLEKPLLPTARGG